MQKAKGDEPYPQCLHCNSSKCRKEDMVKGSVRAGGG